MVEAAARHIMLLVLVTVVLPEATAGLALVEAAEDLPRLRLPLRSAAKVEPVATDLLVWWSGERQHRLIQFSARARPPYRP